MPPPHGNSCQHLAGFLGIAQSNFEKWEDFFPDFPLQPDDATLYKFNYTALTIRVFPLSRGFVIPLQLRIWGREQFWPREEKLHYRMFASIKGCKRKVLHLAPFPCQIL